LNFELLFKQLVKVVLTKNILFVYLNTKKEAYEINKALQEIKRGKTNDIENFFGIWKEREISQESIREKAWK